ncbi:hypothetical protein HPB50_028741 [Hyalomma asiaticum]|nr:hypothetical protein HPB50_028741 [Hyalomma asiaticum]
MLEVPEKMQGALILPFLTEKVRTSVFSQSLSGTLSYAELKEKVLKALKLTPIEYRRRVLEIKKEVMEPASGEAGEDVFLLFAQQGGSIFGAAAGPTYCG